MTSGDKNLKVSEIITSFESIDKMLDQDSSVKLKKYLSVKKKLSLEDKLTVIKTNNSPEEKKLEEKEKKKILEMVGIDKAMKNKKPLMEGNRNLERSCGARRDLGIWNLTRGKDWDTRETEKEEQVGKESGRNEETI